MTRCLSLGFALGLCLGSLGAAAAPAPDSKFGPQVVALVAQAAKEGKLDLSWSGSGFANNGKDVPHWIEAFNRFFGLHLPYTFTPAPSMAQQAAAVMQAAQSKTPAFSDAVILGPDFLLTDIKAHATISRDWAALAKEIGVELPAKAVAPDGAAVAFSTGIFGIVYSKNSVAPNEVPQTLEDVLKPQWKGRLASTPYAAGFSFLAAFDPNWGPGRTDAFVATLAQQIGGLIRCGDPGPLLSGQFDMMVLECDISGTILEERLGVPVGYVIPKDAPISDLWYMAVPKGAPDPAAGTLVALFMLTKEGQDISWQSDGNDLALFSGSRSAALLGGKTATIATSQDFAAHPETLEYIREHIKLLTGGQHR
jgi:spermidine/putrescine-binding protein